MMSFTITKSNILQMFFVDLVLFKRQIQNQHLKFGTSCEAKAITKSIDVILVAFTFTMAWIFFQLLQRVMCNK